MFREFIKDYLSFTRKERLGIFILLFLIVLFIFLPFFYSFFMYHKKYDRSDFDKQIAQLKVKRLDSVTERINYAKNDYDAENYSNHNEPSEKNYPSGIKKEEFVFDPNTASAADWKRLGIKEKAVGTIQKYLSKGGHFYKPEDIGKIWGLKDDDIKRLLPYVKIENNHPQYAKNNYDTNNYKKTAVYERKAVTIIDVNSADTSAFISLPGIGSKLAQRIINFRDKLGGFCSVDQVAQTFGLPDSTFQKIKPMLVLNHLSIKQININSASLDEMKSHPYIRYNLANAIIQFRAQHGNFSSVEDIKKIMLVTDETYAKLFPYLMVEK